MTADTAITASYLLGLLVLVLDVWRARTLRAEARERVAEESPNP
jgi:hypothetical protein